MLTEPVSSLFDMATDTPPFPSKQPPDAAAAADLVRQKLTRIYSEEPDATEEMTEVEAIRRRTKHQEFMYELSLSGKDLVTIQTEWHNYYQSLPESEKHEVWQEFYDSQATLTGQPTITPHQISRHKEQAAQPVHHKKKAAKLREARSADEVQAALRHKVTAGGKLKTKHHIQSLLFGLSMGLVVIVIFLFGFFNEVIIAPFIQPSRTVSSTPLIVNAGDVAASSNPEVIIPKINVQIPVDYTQTSTDESTIEGALENGVVHYPTTVMPGENGNTAFFGHSSNNIFNKGKYKFAFVLLHTLVPGDTFYLTNNGKVYVYKVITRTVVEPSEVGVLGPVSGQTATATLITCDPPGTSLHRLVVVGQQISPDPANNTVAAASQASSVSPQALPGNGPTLLSRFFKTIIGKAVIVAALLGCFVLVVRWVTKPARTG